MLPAITNFNAKTAEGILKEELEERLNDKFQDLSLAQLQVRVCTAELTAKYSNYININLRDQIGYEFARGNSINLQREIVEQFEEDIDTIEVPEEEKSQLEKQMQGLLAASRFINCWRWKTVEQFEEEIDAIKEGIEDAFKGLNLTYPLRKEDVLEVLTHLNEWAKLYKELYNLQKSYPILAQYSINYLVETYFDDQKINSIQDSLPEIINAFPDIKLSAKAHKILEDLLSGKGINLPPIEEFHQIEPSLLRNLLTAIPPMEVEEEISTEEEMDQVEPTPSTNVQLENLTNAPEHQIRKQL